jgi:hypothetical protein
MVPAVWRLCVWIFETLADCHETPSIITPGRPFTPDIHTGNSILFHGSGTLDSSASAYVSNRAGLTRTVLRLCECMPSMQEAVVTSLLSKCYVEEENAPTSTSTSSSSGGGVYVNVMRNINIGRSMSCNAISELDGDSVNLPSLGHSSSEWNIVSLGTTEEECSSEENSRTINKFQNDNSQWETKKSEKKMIFSSALRKTQHSSLLASSVLECLVTKNPEIGSTVLSSIIDRLTPSSPSMGGVLFLPPAAVLHW